MFDFVPLSDAPIDLVSISDIGEFVIGTSPIEGNYLRGWYSSAIGYLCVGRSLVGAPAFVPGTNDRRVIFTMPAVPNQFVLDPGMIYFSLPYPEGQAL